MAHRIEASIVDISLGYNLFKTVPPYTVMSPEFINSVQEELINAIIKSGQPLLTQSNDTRDQLWKAISVQRQWTTSTTYLTGQEVLKNRTKYVCITDHVSGTFTTDWLTNGYWGAIGDAPGDIKLSGSPVLAPGYLNCVADSIPRVGAYADLWARLHKDMGSCTIANGVDALVHKGGHGLGSGTRVYFTTTDALPTGVSVDTIYYITVAGADDFKLSTSWANYLALNYVDTSSAGSGTHTLWFCPFGFVDVNNFNTPGTQGLFARGAGGIHADLKNANAVAFAGYLGALENDKEQGHYHGYYTDAIAGGVQGSQSTALAGSLGIFVLSPVTDGVNGTPRIGTETNPAAIGLQYIIKY